MCKNLAARKYLRLQYVISILQIMYNGCVIFAPAIAVEASEYRNQKQIQAIAADFGPGQRSWGPE